MGLVEIGLETGRSIRAAIVKCILGDVVSFGSMPKNDVACFYAFPVGNWVPYPSRWTIAGNMQLPALSLHAFRIGGQLINDFLKPIVLQSGWKCSSELNRF